MKTYGDIPDKDRKLLKELEILEHWFDTHPGSFPTISAAKGLTLMACDYFTVLEMEEEGGRLLDKAERMCPGYFKGPIHTQLSRDKEFTALMEQFNKNELGSEALKSMGYDNEYEQI